ncbi:(2Fe-2S)-binding protein [Haloferula sargassicola]|uniref:Nicotinate dehydrogenase subunit A n=1 Tax=Haloferula sargassicola TaxID=490096 RepID=A0ABP9ULR2_9BACT
MAQDIHFTLNGDPTTVRTDPGRPLLDVLREDLGLTGTKYGCGEGQCGACSVLIGSERAFSCRTPVSAIAGKPVRTIEGLAAKGELHPVQQAFLEEQAFQCGYCTAGMIMTSVGLLERDSSPDEAGITAAMNGNLCRCCGYSEIRDAVKRAAALNSEEARR